MAAPSNDDKIRIMRIRVRTRILAVNEQLSQLKKLDKLTNLEQYLDEMINIYLVLQRGGDKICVSVGK